MLTYWDYNPWTVPDPTVPGFPGGTLVQVCRPCCLYLSNRPICPSCGRLTETTVAFNLPVSDYTAWDYEQEEMAVDAEWEKLWPTASIDAAWQAMWDS